MVLFSFLALVPTAGLLVHAQVGRLSRPIFPRQSPVIPSACTSTCTAPENQFQTPCPSNQPLCFCDKTLQQQLFDCFNCLGKADNATSFASFQSTLDQLTVACDEGGIPLPKLTFPGQNQNRTLATSATGAPPSATKGGSPSNPTATSSKGASSGSGSVASTSPAVTFTAPVQTPSVTQTAPIPNSAASQTTSGTTPAPSNSTTSGSGALGSKQSGAMRWISLMTAIGVVLAVIGIRL